MSRSEGNAPLLERERELTVVSETLEAASAGEGSLAIVSGPAGIGKTRLLAEAGELASASGFRVLHGRGGAVERDLPWGVVRQLFDPALAELDEIERAELFAGAGGPARSVFGSAPPADEPVSRASAAYGLYWVLLGFTERMPVLAIVDDLHWADEESLQWLSFLAPRIQGVRATIIGGLRSGDPDAARAPLIEIEAEPAVIRLEPAPLSQTAASRLISHAAQGVTETAFVDACHQATAGNPFLLQELVRQLADEHILPTDDNADRVATLRPATIARSVLLRLARLPEPATSLARAVAVLGPGHEVRDLATLAGLDDEPAALALGALADAAILTSEPKPSFVHPLIRDTVYSEMAVLERSLWHQHAARILARAGAAPPQVVPHLLEVRPSNDSWVRETLRAAGKTALDRGAPDLAARLLERARLEVVDSGDDPGLLLELGRAGFAAHGAPGLAPMEEALAASSDLEQMVAIALEFGRALHAVGNHPRAAAIYGRVLSALGEEASDSRRLIRAHYIYTALQDTSTLQGALEQLRQAAAQLSDKMGPDNIVRACLALASAAGGNAGTELAEEALEDGWLVAERTPAIGFAISPLIWSDKLTAAAALWDESIALGRHVGERPWVSLASCFRSQVALRMGDLPGAEAFARDSFETVDLWDLTPPDPAAFLCEILVEQGRAEEAEQVLETCGYDPELPPRQGYNTLLFSRARLHLARGRPQDATEDLRELGARLEASMILNPAAFPWRSLLARSLASSDPEEAAALATTELDRARAFGAPRAIAIALQGLAAVSRGDVQVEHLREAREILEGSPALLERARTTVELGAALRRRGHKRDARTILREGLAQARTCGAHALAERAEGELSTAGARPRRDALRGRDALTASEGRVARMAAEGMTNREIAENLFVVLRTVETHLTSAYGKLEIKSRDELGRALAEHEPPDLGAPA